MTISRFRLPAQRLSRRRFELAPLILVAVVTAGAAYRIVWALTASAEVLVRVIPDDAFYYFQVAHNLAGGYGSTLDGIHLTNGYHPLWLLVLWIFAAGGVVALDFVRLGLVTAVLLNVVSALLVYAILKKATQSVWIGVIGATIYSFDAVFWASSLNGLETSLTTCLFLIACAFWLPVRRLTRGRALALGLILGALFLARTDTVFFIIVIYLALFIDAYREAQWSFTLSAFVVSALVISPWLIWNWLVFGSPVQTSGQALPYVLHELYRLAGNSPLDEFTLGLRYLIAVVIGSSYWLIGGVAIVASRLTPAEGEPNLRQFLRRLTWLWAAGGGLIVVHTLIRWYPRPWYFDQLSVLAILMGGGVWSIVSRTPFGHRIAARLWLPGTGARWVRRITMAVVVGGVALMVYSRNSEFLAEGNYPWQVEMLDAAQWLRTHLDEKETVGAFNAGIMAYFSERRVTNLDGVVNQAAYEAIQRKCLSCFVHDADIHYYVDYDPIMRQEFKPFWGNAYNPEWRLVAEIDRPEVDFRQSILSVYRLVWSQ